VHVVIMGCGRVGSTLARSLEERGHTVAVIDSNPDAFRRLGPASPARRCTGLRLRPDGARGGRHQDAGAFAAVSSGDNSNIISAAVARETFGVDNVVARIYDPGRAEVYQRWASPRSQRCAGRPTRSCDGCCPTAPSRSGATLRQRSGSRSSKPRTRGSAGKVSELEDTGLRVAFITRLGEGMMADAETVLQDGDLLHLVMSESAADSINAAIAAGPEDHG
jgi:trk system potassium uptake protein TrkA